VVTETLRVLRGDADKYGNPNKTDHGTVQGVLSWGTVSPTTPEGGRGESASTGAELFVRRGTDLQPRDRVTREDGQAFRVVGGGQWDRNHPMTARNFGWVLYRLESL
jgi:hypothetical protein